MTERNRELKDAVEATIPRLGAVLHALYHAGKDKRSAPVLHQNLLQELTGDDDEKEAMLVGALAVLRSLGLVRVDSSGRVRDISRHACYAIGSLANFMVSALPVADETPNADEHRYLVQLTKGLEEMREAKIGGEPLHSRTIVNCLIKSRKTRTWKLQDTYLHVYHPDWREYHLVGLSHKDATKTDEEIACQALEQQVGLKPDQYELDLAFHPPEMINKRISATSGALTEYRYRLTAVKEIRIKLQLSALVKQNTLDKDWFRWFTWEEMKARQSEEGEPIMFGIPTAMEKSDLAAVPAGAVSADDLGGSGARVDVLHYLSRRISSGRLLIVAGISLVLLLLVQAVQNTIILLNQASPWLDNVSNIADVLSALFSFLALVTGAGGASLAIHGRS